MPLNPDRVRATLKGMMRATDADAPTGSSLEAALQEWDEYQASLPYSHDLPPDLDAFRPEEEERALLERLEDEDEYRRLTS